MGWTWVSKSGYFDCDGECGGTAGADIGTGRYDKWGEEITRKCNKCSGSGQVYKTYKEREWVDDVDPNKK